MRPYYEDSAVQIFHGDARAGLFGYDYQLQARYANWDVLITDPPYGVNLGGPDIGRNGRGGRHGLERSAYASYDDTPENFTRVVVPVITSILKIVKRGAVFAGPSLNELPRAAAIGGVYCPAGSGRHPWGFKTFPPVLFYGTDPQLQNGARPNVIQSTARAEPSDHPCPKPLAWMRWLVELASLPDETILDPFMGSGTTLRAAKDLGRKAIGIEVEERYCEIAAKRMAQEVMPLGHV